MTPDVTVIGGGIVGLCCAYSLRRAGCTVRIVEAGEVGRGASHANAGWIVPSLAGPLPAPGLVGEALRSMVKPDSPVYIKPRASADLVSWLWRFRTFCNERSYAAGLEAVARLAERTMKLYDAMLDDGVGAEIRSDGLLFAGLDRAHVRDALDGLRPMQEHGYVLPDDVMEPDELRAFEPSLGDGCAAGFFIREERHLVPHLFTAALRDKIVDLGVDILDHTPVTGFRHSARRVDEIVTGAGTVAVEAVLLAGGAWTTGLARLLGVKIAMEAGKGYSFSYRPATAPRRPLYLLEAKVGVTPLPGSVRLAGTMELSGVNTRIITRRVDAIRRSSARFLAEPPDTCTDVWTGMRPVAPDGLPILGRLGTFADAYIATGHSMLGITLGPATGDAMADLITTGNTSMLAPFDPRRFSR